MIAFIGSINDMIIDIRELGLELIKWFIKNKPEILTERFEMKDGDDENAVLIKIANLRGCTKKGNELDYDKAAGIFVNEFRSGKLGRITLQMP
jgi:ribosome biogenesis GTP-binding protein ylqF